jgi:hypothetical protein
MHGIGIEDGIDCFKRPCSVIQIDGQRRQHVGQPGFVQPGVDAGMVLGQLAGLPAQVGQRLAEIHRMLPGAAGNFEYLFAIGKNFLQHGQDGIAVLFAGFGVRFHGVNSSIILEEAIYAT